MTPEVSPDYKCARCGAHGVKLWRQSYVMFASDVRLRCVNCACGDSRTVAPARVNDDGQYLTSGHDMSDQIGSLIPAVPHSDGSFWGYTSVPPDRVEWWRTLPTHEVP